MKNLFRAAISGQNKHVANTQSLNRLLWNGQLIPYVVILSASLLFGACKKYSDRPQTNSEVQMASSKGTKDAEVLSSHSGLDPQTSKELQEAHAATAKYQNIENAFADGYGKDPVVTLPNMGYHFLNADLVSPVFDVRKPAILVYNKKDNGNFELVAVEYAVPMSSLPLHVAPEGFTGSDDEWNENTLNTGWWTLHAWVWKNNPDGVFKPMNPSVIVQ